MCTEARLNSVDLLCLAERASRSKDCSDSGRNDDLRDKIGISGRQCLRKGKHGRGSGCGIVGNNGEKGSKRQKLSLSDIRLGQHFLWEITK